METLARLTGLDCGIRLLETLQLPSWLHLTCWTMLLSELNEHIIRLNTYCGLANGLYCIVLYYYFMQCGTAR